MKAFDLGHTYEESPISVTEAASENEKKVHYPSLYLSGLSEMPDLKDEGEATIKYRVTSRTSTDRDGKKTHSLDLEILSICDCTKPSKEKFNDSKDEMDEIEKGLSKEETQDSDD